MFASSSRNALKRSHSRLNSLFPLLATNSNPYFPRLQHNASLSSKQNPSEETKLHHKLWSFTPDTSFQSANIPRADALGRYNLIIAELASRGNLPEALRFCVQMKSEGIEPNILTYNSLINACRKEFLDTEAWAIYEDMLAFGIRPERETFHRLLQVNRRRDQSASMEVWYKMLGLGIQPNLISYDLLIQRLIDDKNLEMALSTLTDMESRDLSPSAEAAEHIVVLAANLGHPRLAIDLANSYEAGSVRPLSSVAWVRCLISSAEDLYAEGVEICWNKAVHDLRVVPDEGLCINVLHTAGRHGLPALATDVLQVLVEQKITLQEHHFSPLIEAFCASGMIKDAFATLSIMNSGGATPIAETAYPILQAIQSNPSSLDSVCTGLEELRDEGKIVHVSALNCVIQASISQGDLQRAVGAFNSFRTFDVKPNVETFNELLQGCITATHRELGDKLLVEMKEAAVQPNAQTYERLIVLCLTQSTYEDAFFYLEEMKGLNMVPSASIYEALVCKCVSMGDTRFRLAEEEMLECGYKVTRTLRDFIDSRGETSSKGQDIPKPVPRSQNYGVGINRYKRSQFVHTG